MKQRFGKTALVVLSAVALAATSIAETYYVSTSGSNAYDGLARTYDGTHGPKLTIQAGIDAASDGDTVIVLDGTYTGTGNKTIILPADRFVAVQSENGPTNCIVDCQGVSFAFRVTFADDFLLDGFTIRNVGDYGNYDGWGMRIVGCSGGLMQNCVVEDATGYGISMQGSDSVIRDCVVTNTSLQGMHIIGYYGTYIDGVNYVIDNCVVSECESSGMYLGGGRGLVSNCVVFDNSDVDGAGIYADTSGTTIANCVIEGNTASDDGGGVFVTQAEGPVTHVPAFVNCTIINNTAVNGGGYFAEFGFTLSESPTLANCILWNNSASTAGDQIALGPKGEASVAYSDVEGGQNDVALIGPDEVLTWGSGNINSAPLFVTDDYHLTSSSPCIDAGDNSAVPAAILFDIDDDQRFMDDASVADTGSGTAPIVDMGVHESDGARRYYVSTAGSNAYDGLARIYDGTHGPKLTIQAGVDAASDGDTTIVLDGTYTGTGNKQVILPADRFVGVQSENGPANCIVDCQDVSYAFRVDYADDFLLDGFTIRNVGDYGDYDGWGVRFTNCAAGLVQNCVVEDADGYGIFMLACDSTIRDCTVTNTSLYGLYVAGYYGTYIDGVNFVIDNCVISECEDSGMYIGANARGLISNCVITDNSAAYGGGIYADYTGVTVVNCVVEGNTASADGGGLFVAKTTGVDYKVPTFVNCTVINNTAVNGGGFYVTSSTSLSVQPALTNSIVWDNTASTAGDQIALGEGGQLNVSYCDIEGGQNDVALIGPDEVLTWGSGNINSDPLFVTDDYHLTSSSPCIDAGDNAAVPAGTATDIDGDDRIDNDDVDMGADETT